jgi:DNA replication protein DnaC
MQSQFNKVNGIRLTSTFEDYVPVTESQTAALKLFQAMSANLLENSDRIIKAHSDGESPFPAGMLFVLTDKPGVGKTHLLEAMISQATEQKPALKECIFFSKNTPLGYLTGYNLNDAEFHRTFGADRIIIIDDLFSDKEDISKLCKATDIKPLMALIMCAYEQRALVITTSNFSIRDQLLPIIAANDPNGRIVSRCAEICFANSGEITVEGPDHRMEMAFRNKPSSSGFGGFIPVPKEP